MGRRIVKGGDFKPTVAITRNAKDALAAWIDVNHRPHQESIVSAVILWFVSQPKSMQQVVLGQVPKEMKRIYADALRQTADDVERDGISIEPGVVLPTKPPSVRAQARAPAAAAGSGTKSK